ncbi:MAG: EAL domain-containing protein [Gammaproteobacteria bacterium]|nr:EAL domain-containing protein [Gammaproteobacteria bacterium]
MTSIILGISTVLQFIAAGLSIRLILITGRWAAFSLFAIAMTFMGIRRSIGLYHSIINPSASTENLSAEIIALTISLLLVVGILLIAPIFKDILSNIQRSRDNELKLRNLRDDLQKAEAILVEAQKISEIGNWEIDLLAGKAKWSEEVYRIFNADPDKVEATSENFFTFIHPDDLPLVKNIYSDSVEKGEAYEITYRLLLNDGITKYINERCRTFRNDENIPIRSVGTIQDVSSRTLTENALKESEANFRGIYEQAAVGVALISSDTGQILSVNKRCCDIVGYSEEEMLGFKSFEKLVHPDDLDNNLNLLAQLKSGQISEYSMEKRNYHKNGSIVWVNVSVSFAGKPGDVLNRYVVIIEDITERKKTEDELRKLSSGVEASTFSVIITNLEGVIEYTNPNFTRVSGYSKEEVLGKNISLLRSGLTPESTYDQLWNTVRAGGVWKGELQNRKKNGMLYWDRASITGVKNSMGDMTHCITIQDDVTNEYELSEQLSYQASHDSLTGLVNRREFENRAERLLLNSRKTAARHALCYMDVDQLKVVNDTCGHVAGDELLRQLSETLSGKVRKSDTLARLGGDEFGVLMEHCSPEQAQRVADTLLETIQCFQFSWEKHDFKVGISIGLASITKDLPNLTELLKQADAACYIAKDMGRNRIHVYREDDLDMSRRLGEMEWVTRIYQALEKNQFCLFAQTIEPLAREHHRHYELLIRMIDNDGSLIPPGAFLPAAERYNLIEKLDVWVITEAFSLLADNPAFLDEISFISINLSGQSLTKKGFSEFIESQLNDYGIEANKICFEITETTAISNLSIATAFISSLRELGCQFALDDFGSGLSSFGYLKNLSVDYLKIDGMFVKDIVEDPIDRAMVKSINEIGQVMGMRSIAEFVENDEIKGMLREIGVNYAQGYGIDKPRAFEEVLAENEN